MKVVQFNQLIEEHRRSLCSYRSALRRALGDKFSDELNERLIKSINGLGGMLENIYKSMGSEFPVTEYEDTSRIGGEVTFRPLQTVPSIVTDIRGKLAAIVLFVKRCNSKEYAREYKNLVANDNSKVKLTGKYFGQRNSAMKQINEALVLIEGIEEELYKPQEEKPSESPADPPAEAPVDPPAEKPTEAPTDPPAEPAVKHPKAVKEFLELVDKKGGDEAKIIKTASLDGLKKAVKAAKIEVEKDAGKKVMVQALRKALKV